MTNRDYSRISNFFKQEMTPELDDISIAFRNGEYELFGRYIISLNRAGYYTVTDNRDPEKVLEFSALKNAVAWCTLYDTARYVDASRIKKLDMDIASAEVSIEIHRKLSNDSKLNGEARWTQIVKFQEGIRKKKHHTTELQRLINTSKRIQLERFKCKNKQKNFVRTR